MVMLICGCSQVAEALQTCPPGTPRIALDSRYSDNGNNTVTDNETGLIWKRCSEGQSGASCGGAATAMTWSVALAAGANSKFAGFNDWRLPNVKELSSLVEIGCFGPAVNELHFPNTPSTSYWSSSSSSAFAQLASMINFNDGHVFVNAKGGNLHVRLVRGGQ